jgi:hypothetical protein
VIAVCDHEHMFDYVVYTFCMDAALADITDGLGEGFAKLMLYVSEHVLCADDVIAVRRLVDTAELVCTRTVAKFAAEAPMRELGLPRYRFVVGRKDRVASQRGSCQV